MCSDYAETPTEPVRTGLCPLASTGECDRLTDGGPGNVFITLLCALTAGKHHCDHCSEANIPVIISVWARFLWEQSGAKMTREGGVRYSVPGPSREPRCLSCPRTGLAFMISPKISYLKKILLSYQEKAQYMLGRKTNPHTFPPTPTPIVSAFC